MFLFLSQFGSRFVSQLLILLDFISLVLVVSDRSCAVAPVPEDGVSPARVAGVPGSGTTFPDGVVVVELSTPGATPLFEGVLVVELLSPGVAEVLFPEFVAPANATGVI